MIAQAWPEALPDHYSPDTSEIPRAWSSRSIRVQVCPLSWRDFDSRPKTGGKTGQRASRTALL